MRPSNGQNANSGGVAVAWQLADCNAGDVVLFCVGPPHKHRAHAGAIAKIYIIGVMKYFGPRFK